MIHIERATAENWADLESLFRTSAECEGCWCMNHRCKPEIAPTGNEAREALKSLIADGRAFGLLAYKESQCVGWIKNQPGHDFSVEKPEFKDAGAWSIHCLYVASNARAQGVSSQLVKAAVDLAKQEGATSVYAFPIPEETRNKFPEHEAEFSGRLSTYLRLGFQTNEKLNDFYQVVVRDL